MDNARSKIIRARLGDGYSVEDLCLAIDGCAASAFHMGENDTGQRYDSLCLILRDADHVDKFVRAGEHAHRIVAEQIAKREALHATEEASLPTPEKAAAFRRMLGAVRLRKVA